ncbi:6-phosphogluconate dehydratase [Mesocricetibacter intestinalis]|uniref:Phosphogluconate dehydratase n=1 Tax=Mesocricetibacter intestinalis TaxID=1521930 RepID=A0A4R6VLQ8_9PAST|nr:phosphogluconate dehydratase [Mesocricetibacter intestinalis]TDQ59760.1 6-phosphogluconate dehydratase [Mesocricetibacter intestinalis]
MMNSVILRVTENILQRSRQTRAQYLARVEEQLKQGTTRASLSCGNLAHTVAACCAQEKRNILDFTRINLGIVSAYNDMVSAHQPYQDYPHEIKQVLRELGHSAQVAAGVPAMCDGITQGQSGMDLSLFSRDLIAQATTIGLSHNTFDATLLLGVCDKIAPGQLIGALSFGHLPTAFVPAGPMATGISNKEKVKIRQQYAAGEVDKNALQNMENNSYHSAGTCTFYGTANTNQLVFEAMGLMLPGAAFVPVNDPLRPALTALLSAHMVKICRQGGDFRPLAKVVDEKSLVNGLVALLASGGSTNHTIHLIAVARAAGFVLNWDDFDQLSAVVPLLTRVYPNGAADINDFHAAGGVPLLLRHLAERGLFYRDATPIFGSMTDYFKMPVLEKGRVVFKEIEDTRNADVIAPAGKLFSEQGGLKVLGGNLGRGVIKISAVAEAHRKLTAPALVFEDQDQVVEAYHKGELNRDAIVVVRNSGPAARGMPELHKLMPILGNVMEQGFKVALVTDGRLSGASGKVPSVIHLSPESVKGGPLALIRNGDLIAIDAEEGSIQCLSYLSGREPILPDLSADYRHSGRELFGLFRKNVSSAEEGACILF